MIVPTTTSSNDSPILQLNHAHLISDLHLEAGRPHMTAIFERFLATRALEAPALLLLGDVFEVWVGDDDDHPFVGHISQMLSRLVAAGVRVYFMHGNRDFLLGEPFARRVGMHLMTDPVVVQLGGMRTVLAHGDALCTDEVDYQEFRRKARSPQWQSQILAMPLDDRRRLARQMRSESTEGRQNRADAGMGYADVNEATAAALVIDLKGDRLIHGHTHRPATHRLALPDGQSVERVVLSDWHDDRGEALEASPDGTLARHTLL